MYGSLFSTAVTPTAAPRCYNSKQPRQALSSGSTTAAQVLHTRCRLPRERLAVVSGSTTSPSPTRRILRCQATRQVLDGKGGGRRRQAAKPQNRLLREHRAALRCCSCCSRKDLWRLRPQQLWLRVDVCGELDTLDYVIHTRVESPWGPAASQSSATLRILLW